MSKELLTHSWSINARNNGTVHVSVIEGSESVRIIAEEFLDKAQLYELIEALQTAAVYL